jgi:hypothetical protein
MAFFKTFRDQLKANSLITHLEYAQNRFLFANELGLRHVRSALKALVAIKSSFSEKELTSAGWQLVIDISSDLSITLIKHGRIDAAKDCDYITDHAVRWRNEAHERESRGE